ncbi:MAG: hypothetical protein IIB95_08120 [Candidatus Marinimicrobia bacterium]|nr:hypothetical protein [Candidatus Neomarinimicrobiota bacterium]
MHEFAGEYDKADWDYLHAAWVCDDDYNEAAIYCRKRAYNTDNNSTGCKIMLKNNISGVFLPDRQARTPFWSGLKYY